MAEAPRRTGLFALWAILAAIFAHALLQTDDFMARTKGSAFSATTADVVVLRSPSSPPYAKRLIRELDRFDPPASTVVAPTSRITIADPARAQPVDGWPLVSSPLPIPHQAHDRTPPSTGPPPLVA